MCIRDRKEVVWDGVITPDSMWAYARESSAKEQMRLCYDHEVAGTTRWDNSGITERFSQEKMYKQFVDETLGFDSSLIETQEQEQIVLEFE